MGTVRYTVIDGEVVSELRGGVKRDYVPDPLGSTIALLDSSQAKTDSFEYWPYGESAARTGSTATPFQYVGKMGYYCDSSNRNYVRARYLDNSKGRWMTEDPIGYEGKDWNLYRYGWNSPIRITDKSGLICTKIGLDCYGDSCSGNKNCPAKGCFDKVSCMCKMSKCCVVIGAKHVDVMQTANSCGCEHFKGFPPHPKPSLWPIIEDNQKWIKDVISRGCTILDIGFRDMISIPSPYYLMELEEIKKAKHKCFAPTPRRNGDHIVIPQ